VLNVIKEGIEQKYAVRNKKSECIELIVHYIGIEQLIDKNCAKDEHSNWNYELEAH
jgi:hypothetical protein